MLLMYMGAPLARIRYVLRKLVQHRPVPAPNANELTDACALQKPIYDRRNNVGLSGSSPPLQLGLKTARNAERLSTPEWRMRLMHQFRRRRTPAATAKKLAALVSAAVGLLWLLLYGSWEDTVHEWVRNVTAGLTCRAAAMWCPATKPQVATPLPNEVHPPAPAGGTPPDNPKNRAGVEGKAYRGGDSASAEPLTPHYEQRGRDEGHDREPEVTRPPVAEAPLVSLRYALPPGHRFDRAEVDRVAVNMVNQSSDGRNLELIFPYREGQRAVRVWAREVASDLERPCRIWHREVEPEVPLALPC